MRVTGLLLATLIVGSTVVPTVASEDPPPATHWRQSTMDVYVDGQLDREIRVFRAPEGQALALIGRRGSWTIDLPGGEISKRAFGEPTLGETEWQVEPDGAARSTGRTAQEVAQRVWMVDLGGSTALLTPHRGLSGPIEERDVWEAVPAWQALYERYTPDDSIVEALAAIDEPTTLTVAFGTWCGDSRRYVPHLLKTLDTVGNDALDVRLVGLQAGFGSPFEFVRDRAITNAPTLIVERDAREIGRVVETPAGDELVDDLHAILDAEPVGPGERDGELIARGRYRVGSADDAIDEWFEVRRDDEGVERWTTRIDDGRSEAEVVHVREAGGRTRFVQITRFGTSGHSRSRHYRRGDRLSVTTRGDSTGMLQQTLPLAADGAVLDPSTAALALAWRELGRPTRRDDVVVVVLEGADGSPAGVPARLRFTDLGDAGGDAPGARRVAVAIGGSRSEWIVGAELGLPLSGVRADGRRVELVELERF